MKTPSKKTLVVGASPNPIRYAHMATESLVKHGHEVIPMGIRKGEIAGLDIVLDRPPYTDIHTVTLYVGMARQADWMAYILSLKPQRIIFNPGTHNPAFQEEAAGLGIEVVEACTLVMLSIGNY